METIDSFFQANAIFLQWTLVAGWSIVAVGAYCLNFRTVGSNRRAWLLIALLSMAMAIEMAWPHRFAITDLLRRLVRDIGGEEAIRRRRVIQTAVIACLVVPFAILMMNWIVKTRQLTRLAKTGLIGLGVALTGTLLATISLHYIDQYGVIYWFFWFLGLGISGVGVGATFRRVHRKHDETACVDRRQSNSVK